MSWSVGVGLVGIGFAFSQNLSTQGIQHDTLHHLGYPQRHGFTTGIDRQS